MSSVGKVYLATITFVGKAEHSEAFMENLRAALDGDTEARRYIRVAMPHVTAIGPSWFAEPEEPEPAPPGSVA